MKSRRNESQEDIEKKSQQRLACMQTDADRYNGQIKDKMIKDIQTLNYLLILNLVYKLFENK